MPNATINAFLDIINEVLKDSTAEGTFINNSLLVWLTSLLKGPDIEKKDLWYKYMANLTNSVIVRESLYKQVVFLSVLKKAISAV
jgi:hypothetical protein